MQIPFSEPFLINRQRNHEVWVADCLRDSNSFPYKFGRERTKHTTGFVDPRDTITENRGSWCLEPSRPAESTFVVSMPMWLDGSDGNNQKWIALLTMLRDQGFGSDTATSRELAKRQLVVLIGANRHDSVDERINKRFRRTVAQLPLIDGVSYQVIGTTWKMRREATARAHFAGLYSPKKAFALLKILGADRPLLAQIVARDNKDAAALVPYQSLRQWIKRDAITANALGQLRREGRLILWGTMDADLKGLRGTVGLFSCYQQMIREYQQQHDGETPTLMSTGYWAPLDESVIYQTAVEVDMEVRARMALAMGLAPYFPEPNFFIRLPSPHHFAQMSYFEDAMEVTESRKLIASAVACGAVTPESALFRAVPALRTTLPSRFRTKKANRIAITSSRALFQKATLKSIVGLRQSNFGRRNWGHQVALAIPNRRGDYYTYAKHCMALLNAFDVESLSSQIASFGRHSSAKFAKILAAHRPVRHEIFALLENALTPIAPAAQRVAGQLVHVSRGLNPRLLAREITGFIQAARDAQNALGRLGVSAETMGKIRRAAWWSGSAFATVLQRTAEKLDAPPPVIRISLLSQPLKRDDGPPVLRLAPSLRGNAKRVVATLPQEA